MKHRLSVRLGDDLARGLETRAQRSGRTKSEIAREALRAAGVVAKDDSESFSELLERAAALRARQSETTDVVALLHRVRGESSLRLKLMRLCIPIMQADLA
jgi:predicted transcriptional regulator